MHFTTWPAAAVDVLSKTRKRTHKVDPLFRELVKQRAQNNLGGGRDKQRPTPEHLLPVPLLG